MSIEWDMDIDFSGYNTETEARIPIALGRGMEHVRGVAVELAPVLSGHLRGSAGVTVAEHTAILTFEGPYARYQHYGLDFRHPQGGQALYLEQPMLTEADTVVQIIADALGLGAE